MKGKRPKTLEGFPRKYTLMRLGCMLFVITLIIVPSSACGTSSQTSTPTPTHVALPTPTPADCVSGTIAVGGSTALQALVYQAAQSYQTMCPQATILVNQTASASEDGLRQVEAGSIQIGDSDLLSSKKDLIDHPVAVVIYVLVLNQNLASITNLDISQIQSIYNGSITNWEQAGGPNLPIYPVSRTSASGTRRVFEKYVLQGPETLLPKHEVSTTSTVASTVATTPGAIGYVDLGTATQKKLSTVSIGGVEALPANLNNNRYTFWTVEHMYTKGTPSGLTQAFLEYMQGNQVQQMINDLYYVPINELPSNVANEHSPVALQGL